MGYLILRAGINNKRVREEEIPNLFIKNEAKLTTEFRRLLTKELINLKVVDNYGKDENMEWKLKHNGINNLSLDIHFNFAFSSIINGTEVCVPFTNNNSIVANNICVIISNSLGTKNRGVKTTCTSYNKELVFINNGYINYTLEICFITNKEDLIKYETNKLILIKELSNLLKQIL